MEQILNDIIQDDKKIIFTAICLLIICEFTAGIIFLIKTKTFVQNAKKIMADVIKVEEYVYKGKKYYKLFLSFKDQLGNLIEPPAISVGKAYSIGDKLEILSDKNNPEKIKNNNIQAIYILPFAIIMSSVFLIIMLAIMTKNNIASIPF